MAEQKVFTTYRAPVESFPLGEQRVGLLKPGRYNGFDGIVTTRALGIMIHHTGKVRKTTNQGVEDNEFGAILMPTGIVIHHYVELYLTLEDTIINPDSPVDAPPRTDLLICEHNYTAVPDGAPATFFIVTGPTDGTTPSIPDPTRQVVLGEFKVTGNFAINANIQIDYIPRPAPFTGDMGPTGLFETIKSQVIAQIQETAPSIDPTVVSNTTKGVAIVRTDRTSPGETGNTYEVKGFSSPDRSISITGQPEELHLRINPPSIRQAVQDMDFAPNQTVRAGNLELSMGLAGKRIFLDPEGAEINVTIPATGLTQKYNVEIIQLGTGSINIVNASGVTLLNPHTGNKVAGELRGGTISRVEHLPNTYLLGGDLIA